MNSAAVSWPRPVAYSRRASACLHAPASFRKLSSQRTAYKVRNPCTSPFVTSLRFRMGTSGCACCLGLRTGLLDSTMVHHAMPCTDPAAVPGSLPIVCTVSHGNRYAHLCSTPPAQPLDCSPTHQSHPLRISPFPAAADDCGPARSSCRYSSIERRVWVCPVRAAKALYAA